MERLMFTVPEAAHKVGLSRSKLYQLMLRGEFPSVTVGRSRRVPVAALEAWVAGLSSDEWVAHD
ncbi:MAG: helix-turn-helix domain-containing protein [Fimbriimonadaceae bacterium]|nr:helix-turn-helix domain-containing protein [Fimbriimonadaceae bacterium]